MIDGYFGCCMQAESLINRKLSGYVLKWLKDAQVVLVVVEFGEEV